MKKKLPEPMVKKWDFDTKVRELDAAQLRIKILEGQNTTLTRAELKPSDLRALLWFAEQTEPKKLFGMGDPSLASIGRLQFAGYLETVPTRPGDFTAYQISAAGRTALQPPVK